MRPPHTPWLSLQSLHILFKRRRTCIATRAWQTKLCDVHCCVQADITRLHGDHPAGGLRQRFW